MNVVDHGWQALAAGELVDLGLIPADEQILPGPRQRAKSRLGA